MGTRPRTALVLSRKRIRCKKCGAALHARVKRCKKCHKVV
jgi:hypothetical protein